LHVFLKKLNYGAWTSDTYPFVFTLITEPIKEALPFEYRNCKYLVTNEGGTPHIYINGDAVMAVAVETSTGFSIVGTPRILFRGIYVSNVFNETSAWDIDHNGKRFLMVKPPASKGEAPTPAGPRKINVVVNWLEELKQRVPAK
jgi:hypothetical protein